MRPHPHGLVGHVLDDPDRTARAERLLRLARAPFLFAVVVLAVAFLGAAVVAPAWLAGVLGGGSALAAGGVAVRRWRGGRAPGSGPTLR